MDWIYKGRKVTSINDMPPGAIGFVYVMTIAGTGHRYVGKKNLYSYITKPVEGKKRRQRIVKESNWLKYYSSNEQVRDLQRLGETIDREIVEYCYSPIELTYAETRYLFIFDAIRDPLYLNSNILGKFYRGRV